LVTGGKQNLDAWTFNEVKQVRLVGTFEAAILRSRKGVIKLTFGNLCSAGEGSAFKRNSVF
jgi:hypothetical protein